uniref:Uncharacterized protein n=1 Tax=Anguilla anguilla TaxID=7936 RepID=A0A0E9QEL8_ANGAN
MAASSSYRLRRHPGVARGGVCP